MNHKEFRKTLLDSLGETMTDSRKKRDEAVFPIQYVVHNAYLELLGNLLRYVDAAQIDECCHEDPPVEPIKCSGCNGTCGTCLCEPACNAVEAANG